MTSLRFVGDLPLWAGVTLSVIGAVMSWKYYRRESFDLPQRTALDTAAASIKQRSCWVWLLC